MSTTIPYVLSIAGFDPSAGAGVLADCKTFEQHGVYGFGVCSALTVQSDSEFFSVRWMTAEEIIEQLRPLAGRFTIAACKIGIIHSLQTVQQVVQFLKAHNPHMQIVWDPVLKASAGFSFHAGISAGQWIEVMAGVDLLTPNYNEWEQLPALISGNRARYCPVLLKGGHRTDAPGTDILYEKNNHTVLPPGVATVWPKHGSGCVLSASITANRALGYDLQQACRLSKQYIENYLNSNASLLGYHNKINLC